MSISEIKKSLRGFFQGALKNLVSLADDSTLEGDLKPLKVGDTATPIEISTTDVKIRGTLDAQAININNENVNPSQAGTILAYTDIGLNEARVSLNLTTSYVVPTDEFGVTFTAPPSGKVEIMMQIRFNCGSSGAGDLYAGLSIQNATSGYDTLGIQHEELLTDQSGRNGLDVVQNYWTLDGLTGGSSYTRYIGFKSSSTTGTPQVQWGGSSSGHNSDFIMKATALPNSIST